ncbi:MAG: hypothetical protein NC489_24035 [Ruminococcus flavefaciens]|nr:hypothetical protein [Ruminococcus flavefaciens]
MKNKYARFPLTMTILAFLYFLFIVFFMSTAVQPLWERICALLIPTLVLGGISLLALKGMLDSRKTAVLTVFLSVIFLLASICYTVMLSLWTATTVTTDVKYYSRAYAQIEDGSGVKGVFPQTVPTDAKDISFHYNPAFLQGGEVFQFSYTVTEEKMSEWTALLEGVAEWIGSNEEWHRTNNWGFYGTDSIRYHLYWDGNVNHGEMCYVLIVLSNCRITFCYENW